MARCISPVDGVYSLDAATGAERWKLDMRGAKFPGAHPGYVTLSSPIFADGKDVISGTLGESYLAGGGVSREHGPRFRRSAGGEDGRRHLEVRRGGAAAEIRAAFHRPE